MATTTLGICSAIAALFASATALECPVGPYVKGTGDTSYVLEDVKATYTSAETCGEDDTTATYTLITETEVIGDAEGNAVVHEEVERRAGLLRDALRADPTLGQLVAQARISSIEIQVVRPNDNTFRAGAWIDMEVRTW